jgi:hypothetical protein
MIRVLLIFWTLVSLGRANPDFSVFDVGEAPAGGVYDPLDWLEGEKREELEESHRGALAKWGVRIFVVILPEKPTLGVDVFAKKIGRDWGGNETWGVLLHVVGDSDSPWCAAERGENLRWTKQEEFDRALEGAMSRAHREPDQDLSVMVGARELTDELGFLGIISNRRDQMLGKAREERVQKAGVKFTKRKFVQRAWMIGGPLALILGIAVFLFLRSRSRERMTGFEFPETAPRRRFHGPWSGGGNVLVTFSGKTSEKGSRRG